MHNEALTLQEASEDSDALEDDAGMDELTNIEGACFGFCRSCDSCGDFAGMSFGSSEDTGTAADDWEDNTEELTCSFEDESNADDGNVDGKFFDDGHDCGTGIGGDGGGECGVGGFGGPGKCGGDFGGDEVDTDADDGGSNFDCGVDAVEVTG